MVQPNNDSLRELPDNIGKSNSGDIPLIEYNPDGNQLQSIVSFGETDDTVIVGDEYFQAQKELEFQLVDTQVLPSSLPRESQDYVGGAERVLGTGIGFRTVGGYLTPEVGLKVYVTEKTKSASASSLSSIPSQIRNLPVDVEQVGEVTSYLYNQRYQRSFNCGVSIGNLVETGTLGCLVQLENGKLCLLSNNHVIANLNRSKIGDPILQPGPQDSGQNPQDSIGILEDFVTLNFTGNNKVDAAVAWTTLRSVKPNHVTYTLNPTPLQPRLGMTVVKNGRTTQATIGTITELGINILVNYPTGSANFVNQIGIRGIGNNVFSRRGDSGSLIVSTNSKQPVALLFAGMNNDTLTLANPINEVMSALKIRRFIDRLE